MAEKHTAVSQVGSRASLRIPSSETLFFGEVSSWNGNEVCVLMEEASQTNFGVGTVLELRVYTVHHAEILEALVVGQIKGSMMLQIQPGCRVDRDTPLARWTYTTTVCFRVLEGPVSDTPVETEKEQEGTLYDICPTGLSLRAEKVPPVGSRLELKMQLGKRELTATGTVRNIGLRGSNSFGVELSQLSRVDLAVLRSFLNDYREEVA